MDALGLQVNETTSFAELRINGESESRTFFVSLRTTDYGQLSFLLGLRTTVNGQQSIFVECVWAVSCES